VNGVPIQTVEDAQRAIYGAGVGDKLKLGIERDGHARSVELTLVEAPRESK